MCVNVSLSSKPQQQHRGCFLTRSFNERQPSPSHKVQYADETFPPAASTFAQNSSARRIASFTSLMLRSEIVIPERNFVMSVETSIRGRNLLTIRTPAADRHRDTLYDRSPLGMPWETTTQQTVFPATAKSGKRPGERVFPIGEIVGGLPTKCSKRAMSEVRARRCRRRAHPDAETRAHNNANSRNGLPRE